MIKKIQYIALSTFFCLALATNSFAQVFWTEGFQNGCVSNCLADSYVGPNGAWTISSTGVNDVQSNLWYVSGAECGNSAGTCGSVCGATDPSLHISANGITFGDVGAVYDATLASPVRTNLRVESPFINCVGHFNNIIHFNYIERGDSIFDDAALWYFNGTWSQLDSLKKTDTTCGSSAGLWKSFSIALPASADNNPNVKIGFLWTNNNDNIGTDPSFAVDDITVEDDLISTGTISGSPFCECASVMVPYSCPTSFFAGNVFTAELSDEFGSFASPVSIGSSFSTLSSGTISCTMPCTGASITGSSYRIRVTSSAPAIPTSDNGIDLTLTRPSDPTFDYASPFCHASTNPFPTFPGSSVAGIFSSSPAGMFFANVSTGEIDLSSTLPGNYTITNTIAATGGCPLTSFVSLDTVLALTNIYGHATYSGGSLISGNNTAVLYNHQSFYTHFDTAQIQTINTSGDYVFSNVYEGDYILKIFPDTIANPAVVPTYYDGGYLWDYSTLIYHGCSVNDTLDVTMAEEFTGSGPGLVCGNVFEGPGYVRFEGDPIPGIDVKLGHNPGGQLQQSTQTDINGAYAFINVPINMPGDSYTVYIDIPGLQRDSVYTFVIDASNYAYSGLNYYADSNSVYPFIPVTNVASINNDFGLTVYPNPTNSNSTISFDLPTNSFVQLDVYDIVGNKVESLVNTTLTKGKQELKLSKINPGIYFIKLSTNGNSTTIRLVVID